MEENDKCIRIGFLDAVQGIFFHLKNADEFKDPTIDLQRAERVNLWGLPIMMVLIEAEGGWELNDIISFATKENCISSFRHYYFCHDFLAAAAVELGVRLQRNKMYKIV